MPVQIKMPWHSKIIDQKCLTKLFPEKKYEFKSPQGWELIAFMLLKGQASKVGKGI